MLSIITIIIPCLFIIPSDTQKHIHEMGESEHPYMVNMWIPKNRAIGQEKSRLCDAIQLTPFTDYFFTTSKCFDHLEHEMWLENIGISYDERINQYSRHMSFLTRYKEEGGHFVILERFETNPLEYLSPNAFNPQQEKLNVVQKSSEIEDLTKSADDLVEIVETIVTSSSVKPTTKISIDNDDYEKFPDDLSQYDEMELNYEINEQVEEDPNMKHLRMMRNKKVKLSTPDVRGATECYVLGWGSYLRQYETIQNLEGLSLKKEIVRKLPRRECRDPDPSHICIVKTNGQERECVEDLGSPLVCERRDPKNFTIGIALVGIYTGFKNCVTTDIGVFRSLTSELPWIARWAKGTPITTSAFNLDNSRSNRMRSSRRRTYRRTKKRRRGASSTTHSSTILILISSILVNRYFIFI